MLSDFFLIIAGTNVQASVIVANQDIEGGFQDMIIGPRVSEFGLRKSINVIDKVVKSLIIYISHK